MKHFLAFILVILVSTFSFAQDVKLLKGKVVNTAGFGLENVHVVNLNQVVGSITNKEGDFSIKAVANDTLHFSFLGYKSIKIKVTNDWINFGSSTIELTESAYALEEILILPHKLTGYLEIDSKYIPINKSYRYSISGLSKGYEAGKKGPGAINKVLGAIFNPADLLYNTFSKKGRQMRKLRDMKKDDEIRNLLINKFDRDLLTSFLQIDKGELEDVLTQCNYSKEFIKSANDLQILDAISGCYEEYKVLKRKK
ncbi:carboxypeptidase-like regulatory domain-containing protein [Pseudofulvibacter geojedonensis]|uniref:Carboxypeptidase-like regulatory domain-containing protein n=1 Tax=Pseudofulvibacter geojedonensis TaxID=1123758 RepID=A0ABW3HZJ8_9FLAO